MRGGPVVLLACIDARPTDPAEAIQTLQWAACAGRPASGAPLASSDEEPRMCSSSAGIPVAPSTELAPAAGDADDGMSLAHSREHTSAASQDTGREVVGEKDQASKAQVTFLRPSVRQSGLHHRWLMLFRDSKAGEDYVYSYLGGHTTTLKRYCSSHFNWRGSWFTHMIKAKSTIVYIG